ncbi:hypothetical protein [Streptococcus pluranimalium]|uniref:Uncharacterized protein n=1 Tax=Streptococcus pluranimalium TaxID=82348 RepID=A0A345VMX5_9STRE|nr:hypothetical protein [Streptococcus pluranimalium]AXJ14077.1 hypothetical protein Sp14A_21950 [Streptococcus pluranimalium]
MKKQGSGKGLFKQDKDFNKFSQREQAVYFIGSELYSKEKFLESSHQSIIHSVYKTFSSDDFRVPHEVVAKLIYASHNLNDVSDIDIISENLNLFHEYFHADSGFSEKAAQVKLNFDKLLDSIRLCIVQKKYIEEQANSLIAEAKKLQKENNKISKSLKRASKEIKEIKNIRGSVYTDFIAILGVFSAFVFLGFGGISMAQAIYDSGSDMKDIPLSNMVMVSSFMLIVVLTMIYSILYWLSRIIDRKFENHKFYIILMVILVVTSIVSSFFEMKK